MAGLHLTSERRPDNHAPTFMQTNVAWTDFEPANPSRRAAPPSKVPTKNAFANGTATTAAQLQDAFFDSNALAALQQESAPPSRSRRALQLTDRGVTDMRRTDHNILPSMIVSPFTAPDDYFLGGLRVEDYEVSDKKFVDRAGNEHDILTATMPPAQKDHGQVRSNARLQHVMGYDPNDTMVNRKKKEVKGHINPPMHNATVQQERWRRQTLSMSNRNNFMNRTHMQSEPSIDRGRQNYEGLNPKRVATRPLQATMRHVHVAEAPTRSDQAWSEAPVNVAAQTKRSESGRFFRQAGPTMERNTRAETYHASASGKRSQKNAYVGLPMQDSATVSLPQTDTPRRVPLDDKLASTTKAKAYGHELPASSPASVVVKDGQRNTINVVDPTPSVDSRIARRIVESVDHLGGDDNEVDQITNKIVQNEQGAKHVAAEVAGTDAVVVEDNVRPAAAHDAQTFDAGRVVVRRQDVAPLSIDSTRSATTMGASRLQEHHAAARREDDVDNPIDERVQHEPHGRPVESGVDVLRVEMAPLADSHANKNGADTSAVRAHVAVKSSDRVRSNTVEPSSTHFVDHRPADTVVHTSIERPYAAHEGQTAAVRATANPVASQQVFGAMRIDTQMERERLHGDANAKPVPSKQSFSTARIDTQIERERLHGDANAKPVPSKQSFSTVRIDTQIERERLQGAHEVGSLAPHTDVDLPGRADYGGREIQGLAHAVTPHARRSNMSVPNAHAGMHVEDRLDIVRPTTRAHLHARVSPFDGTHTHDRSIERQMPKNGQRLMDARMTPTMQLSQKRETPTRFA